jgi:hypothetical protein
MKTFELALIIIVFMACHQKNSQRIEGIEEGIYTGEFKVVYPTGTHTGKTTLELRNSKYTCEGNANRIPAGGSGTYSINNNKITFHDENIWTADFDWNLILNGEYDYSFDGKKLKLSTDRNHAGHYEYNLTKK